LPDLLAILVDAGFRVHVTACSVARQPFLYWDTADPPIDRQFRGRRTRP
jgi:hypothetical protein